MNVTTVETTGTRAENYHFRNSKRNRLRTLKVLQCEPNFCIVYILENRNKQKLNLDFQQTGTV